MNIKEIDGVKYVTYDEHQKTVILAIQLEREACAKTADEQAIAYARLQDFHGLGAAESIADAIRARSQ
jgi:hypothetical protein